jgi:2,3,4,5-tetrahydropyridine-2-carboxylate N-succinyltransferase
LSNLRHHRHRLGAARGDRRRRRVDAEAHGTPIERVLGGLDAGAIRVAEKRDGTWTVNQWVKQAVLLSFRINENTRRRRRLHELLRQGAVRSIAHYDAERFKQQRHARRAGRSCVAARYVAPDVVLMPSFVNIGATSTRARWSTRGRRSAAAPRSARACTCRAASAIGGVLEPMQAAPTIIEDDCFIGARSEVVEGVVVERGSVLGMGVYIGQSTKIYDRETGEVTTAACPPARSSSRAICRRRTASTALYCAGDRQEGRREDALEDVAQRAAAYRRLRLPSCPTSFGR